jgi:branched-chain amino acid transport system ATP-binding protein
MILSAEHLTVCYGAITALQDVSVQIAQGEIVTLIGANGAGKTTLLRTISGLLKPTAGSIEWHAAEGGKKQLVGLRPDQIVRLGVSHVPEGRQVFSNLTVKENLTLGAFPKPGKEEIARGMERCFGLFPVLKDRQNQRSGTLSGGEQQMLAIGRALMAQPRVLLLDEPSLGLAPMIVRKIFEIIGQINREGATIFLVEQNANMALTVAHRGYVMQSGKILLSDSAAKLLQDPQVKRAYLGG